MAQGPSDGGTGVLGSSVPPTPQPLTRRSLSVAASSSAISRAIAFSCSWAFVLRKEGEESHQLW